MSDSYAAVATAKPGWGGGVSPFAVGDKKLGMWLFIVSDALTFSTLIVAYCYVRIANEWPKPFEFFSGDHLRLGDDFGPALEQFDDGFRRRCRP